MYDTLKRTVLISLAAILILPLFMVAFSANVQAAPYSEDTVQEKAEAWLFARALSKCFKETRLKNGFLSDQIDEGNAKDGKWFMNDPVNTQSYDLGIIVASIVEGGDAEDGSLECSWGDDNVVDETLSRLGLDPIEALCGMGDVWKREHPGSTPGESCSSGTGHFETDDAKSDKIQEAWNGMVRSTYLEGKGLQDSLTDAMRYWISLESFRVGCQANFKAIYTNQSVDGDKKYKTPLYNSQTGEIEQWYVETQKGNDVITVGGNGLFDSDNKQHCATLEANLDKYVDAYVAAVKAEKESDTDGSQTGSAPQPICEADGFGWVICPLINMMAQITETVAEFLDDYLRIQPLTTDTDSVLYKGWRNIVGIANILLIIAFMLIVISQVTSIGIGNYGVKKLLPRILAAAILINISYFICAILVDLSNIAGSGISNLIYSNLGGISGDEQEGGFIGGIKNVAGGVAAGAIGVSGLVIVAFFFLIPAVIAILSIFVVLAARTAIITLLIIIAPLAFAAWILPNTDKWFRKWWDVFLQMLVVYPAIMAIFAASTAAATIVVDSTGASTSETPGPGNLFPLLIGLLIQALPLFALPALIKLSSGVLARLDTMTRGGRFAKAGQGFFENARDRRVRNVGARMATNKWQNKNVDASSLTGRALQRTQRKLGQTSALTGGYKARRDFTVENQKQSAERAQRRAILGQVSDTDSSFAQRAAGVEGAAGVARLRAIATQQAIKERAEETDAHAMNLTRNSSMLAAAGYSYRDGQLQDSSGAVSASRALEVQQRSGVEAFDASGNLQLDVATQRGLEYASDNNLAESVAGARAIGATLAKTGALETKHLESLIGGLKDKPGVSVDDIAYTVDFMNDQAASAGLRHLQYNNVSASGDMQLGANMGGKNGVIDRIMQEGVSKITKEMYADNEFGKEVATRVHSFEQANPDNFKAELTRMNPRQIENLIKAKVQAGLIPPQSQAIAYQSMLDQQAEAIKELGNH